MLGRMVGALFLLAGCDRLFGFDHVPLVVDGAAGDGAAGDAPHACLDGTFSTPFNAGQLDVHAPTGGSTDIVNGQVEINWPELVPTSNYGSVGTQAKFDLTGGGVAVDLLGFSGPSADADLAIYMGGSHYYAVTVDLATVQFYVDNGGGESLVGSMGYGVLPLHLSLSIDAGATTVTYSASTHDATFTMDTPIVFPVQSVNPQFDAGSYTSAASSGTATFDNFVVASPTCL